LSDQLTLTGDFPPRLLRKFSDDMAIFAQKPGGSGILAAGVVFSVLGCVMSECCLEENKVAETEQPGDDAGALFVLGNRYSTGRDVKQDLIAAHKWFNLAAMMGHEGAFAARADLASEMTSEQIAEAQRQARAWLWSRNAPQQPAEQAAKAAAVRPIYVWRRAQAMRSAKSFARVVA
jgi:uncharacterized protein